MRQAQCNYLCDVFFLSIFILDIYLDERLIDGNKFYYKVPSSEGACMALHARKKMNIDPERRMIGLS